MNESNVAFWALIGYTVTAPTLAAAGIFGSNNRVEVGILLLTVGVTASVLTRLKDITIIKLGILQAKLERKIKEATVTIEQLRALAKAFAEPTITNLAIGHYLSHYEKFSERYRIYQEVDQALANIGVSDIERNKISSQWKDEACGRLAHHILHDIYNSRHDLKEKIRILDRKNNHEPAMTDEYRKFLEQNNLLDDEHNKRIENYEDFLENKRLRHPECAP